MLPPPDRIANADITLRRIHESDTAEIAAAVAESGTALSDFESWAQPPFTMVEASHYVAYWTKAWNDATAYYYTVEDSSGMVCGSCGLGDLDTERSTTAIGYWIRSSATGRGLATAAVRAIAAAAWDEFSELSIVVAEANVASRRVAEKAGAALRPGFGGTVYAKGAQVPGLQYVMLERPQ